MQNSSNEYRIRTAFLNCVNEMLRIPRATGRDYGNGNRLGNGASEHEVIAVARAIAIDAGKENLTRAEFNALLRPTHGIE
jgi:hypothetical protein